MGARALTSERPRLNSSKREESLLFFGILRVTSCIYSECRELTANDLRRLFINATHSTIPPSSPELILNKYGNFRHSYCEATFLSKPPLSDFAFSPINNYCSFGPPLYHNLASTARRRRSWLALPTPSEGTGWLELIELYGLEGDSQRLDLAGQRFKDSPPLCTSVGYDYSNCEVQIILVRSSYAIRSDKSS